MTKSEEWLRETERRASSGDPRAEVALAWEYVKGEGLEKSFPTAVELFRRAESKLPEFARFNLAKAKILENLPFEDEISADCDRGYGPALYLMAAYTRRSKPTPQGLAESLRYLRLAAQSGHLASEFLLWRLERQGLMRRLISLIPALRALFRGFVITYRDPEDPRVLT